MHKRATVLIASRWGAWTIIAFWVVVAALAGPLAGSLSDVEKNEATSWLPASAESTKVLDAQAAFASPNTVPAVVIYEKATPLTPADLRTINDDARAFAQLPDLDGTVVGPVPAADGAAAQLIVPLDLGEAGWERAGDVVDSMRTTIHGSTTGTGLTAHVTGPAGFAADSAEAFGRIDTSLLIGTVLVVVVILLLTYRSPVLWLIPVISAGVALTAAQAVIYLLAKNTSLTVNGQSAGILTVLVFGAGTDYALLLTARYREELRRDADRRAAMSVALHRAGPAIVASAATVVAGMLCLVLAETNSTAGLGPVAAIGIVVGLAVMLTLLPALLVTCGRWIFWPRVPHHGSPEPTAHGVWARLGDRIARAPRRTWIITSIVLALLARWPRHARPHRTVQQGVFSQQPGLHRRGRRARPALPGRHRQPHRGDLRCRPGRAGSHGGRRDVRNRLSHGDQAGGPGRSRPLRRHSRRPSRQSSRSRHDRPGP